MSCGVAPRPGGPHLHRAYVQIRDHLYRHLQRCNDSQHHYDADDNRHQGAAINDLLKHLSFSYADLLPRL